MFSWGHIILISLAQIDIDFFLMLYVLKTITFFSLKNLQGLMNELNVLNSCFVHLRTGLALTKRFSL